MRGGSESIDDGGDVLQHECAEGKREMDICVEGRNIR